MDVDFDALLSRVQLQPDKPETCPMARAKATQLQLGG